MQNWPSICCHDNYFFLRLDAFVVVPRELWECVTTFGATLPGGLVLGCSRSVSGSARALQEFHKFILCKATVNGWHYHVSSASAKWQLAFSEKRVSSPGLCIYFSQYLKQPLKLFWGGKLYWKAVLKAANGSHWGFKPGTSFLFNRSMQC